MIHLLLIRHGSTAWNAGEGQGERFRGLVDLPLAEGGVAQAQITARRLAPLPLDAIYSSPLQRALHTARIIAEPHGLVPIPLAGLRSMDYGQWAEQLVSDVARDWPEQFRQWRRNPFAVVIPGGERALDLRERATAAVRGILQRHRDGAVVALVSHEIVCRTLTCALLGMPDPGYWQIRQDLCSLTAFDYEAGSGRLLLSGLNDSCHLDPALPRARGDGVRVILVRHGQTAWNLGAGEERFRGRTDLPLDSAGLAQARAVGERLRQEPIAAVYASPLLRARQTLAPLAESLGLAVQTHAGLLDLDYGAWQGLSHGEAAAAYPELYSLWRTAPSQVRFPEGECLADVRARLGALLDELALRFPARTVVLVGHQMVNKVAACSLLGLDLDQIGRVQQDTAGLDVFQRVRDSWHTLCLNHTCHLA